MSDTRTNELTQRWVLVADESGRSHLEARWVVTSQAEAPRITSAA